MKHSSQSPMKTRVLKGLLTFCALLLTTASQAQVGMRLMASGGMPITVVYPTVSAARTLTQGPFVLQVASNAPPLPMASGKRRLIVLSHGTAGSAWPDHALATTLAHAGFAVAQPEHRGDNWQDFSRAGPQSWQTRPQDVSDTIDAVAHDPVLGPLVDTRRVGVHGMSAGGVSGLALAGAQWRMLDLTQHCAQHMDEDIGFCLNGLAGQAVQQMLRKEQFAMARMLTEGTAPAFLKTLHGGKTAGPSQYTKTEPQADPRPDPRVAAVSLLVPVGAIFTPESLARIRIPVGLTVAEADQVLVPRFHSQHVLQHCRGCRVLSHHAGAGHFDWLAPWPAELARNVAATQMRGGLPHAEFTSVQRQSGFDLIAAFFLQELPP